MNYYGNYTEKLIEEFSKLPGIGHKSAQRMAFYILNSPYERSQALAEAIMNAKIKSKYCKICYNLTDNEICYVCANENREQDILMIVESPADMAAYEKTKEYRGLYHILHGAISPIDGVGPSELKIKELLERLKTYENGKNIQEIIIATNPNIEGEATALYLAKLLKPIVAKITRIAHGVPVGSDLEYADPITLMRALEWRRDFG